MELKQYWDGMSREERARFAAKCGTSAGYIQNIVYGIRSCNVRLAVALDRESGGAVDFRQLAPGVDWGYVELRLKGLPVSPPSP